MSPLNSRLLEPRMICCYFSSQGMVVLKIQVFLWSQLIHSSLWDFLIRLPGGGNLLLGFCCLVAAAAHRWLLLESSCPPHCPVKPFLHNLSTVLTCSYCLFVSERSMLGSGEPGWFSLAFVTLQCFWRVYFTELWKCWLVPIPWEKKSHLQYLHFKLL